MIGGRNESSVEFKRSLRRQESFKRGMVCITNYLKSIGSDKTKQYRKIQEFMERHQLPIPKTKIDAVSNVIGLYESGRCEDCREGSKFQFKQREKITIETKAKKRNSEYIEKVAQSIDSVLDRGENIIIKLSAARLYLVDYCGYRHSDVDEMELYVFTDSIKKIVETSQPIHGVYLKSHKWHMMKESIRERDNYTCSDCGKNMSNDLYNLHTHHLTYERLGNEHPEDLVLLCADCHYKKHSKK